MVCLHHRGQIVGLGDNVVDLFLAVHRLADMQEKVTCGEKSKRKKIWLSANNKL
jgi:hypothetical protein